MHKINVPPEEDDGIIQQLNTMSHGWNRIS